MHVMVYISYKERARGIFVIIELYKYLSVIG
jgi:hypothetical protein